MTQLLMTVYFVRDKRLKSHEVAMKIIPIVNSPIVDGISMSRLPTPNVHNAHPHAKKNFLRKLLIVAF